jgi:hypothetical protein
MEQATAGNEAEFDGAEGRTLLDDDRGGKRWSRTGLARHG